MPVYTPIQRAELKIRKLEKLYDEQYVLLENYKDYCFGSKTIGMKFLFSQKEEYTKKIGKICSNVEKFILECEKITNKIADKNIAHVSIGMEKLNLKKHRAAVVDTVGYGDWTVFKSNKRSVKSPLHKCFEQDIWNLLNIKHFPGIDETILEEKLQYIFDNDALSNFFKSNGATIKKFVFFKHPTPSKETLETRRKTVEIKEEKEKAAQNPYKTAEKTKAPSKMQEDDSSESDVSSPKSAKTQKRREKEEKKARKEKRAKKEADLRERERSDKIAEKIKREKTQKISQTMQKSKSAMGESSSSDENAIRPVLQWVQNVGPVTKFGHF